jgi:signal transduction histidine kinase
MAFTSILEGYRDLEEALPDLRAWNEEVVRRQAHLCAAVKRLQTHFLGDDLQVSDFDFHACARRALGLLPKEMWVVRGARRPFRMRADPYLIEHVLYELIHNSRQFARAHDELRLSLRAGVVRRALPRRVRVVYTDNGPGIPASEKERVFDFGFSRKANGDRGPGLGLNFVRRVVEKHQGRVWEQGVEGRGVEFIIELPQPRPPETNGGGHVPHSRGR